MCNVIPHNCLRGLDPNIVCVTDYIAPLDNSVAKVRACTRHTYISKNNNINNYNKNTKNSLYVGKIIHKYSYALIVHSNTSLHNEIICTLVTMHGILELKHLYTKLPFLKVMLHPAPQIKLCKGEDLEITRKNHLLKNTQLKLTKIFSKKNTQHFPTNIQHYLTKK